MFSPSLVNLLAIFSCFTLTAEFPSGWNCLTPSENVCSLCTVKASRKSMKVDMLGLYVMMCSPTESWATGTCFLSTSVILLYVHQHKKVGHPSASRYVMGESVPVVEWAILISVFLRPVSDVWSLWLEYLNLVLHNCFLDAFWFPALKWFMYYTVGGGYVRDGIFRKRKKQRKKNMDSTPPIEARTKIISKRMFMPLAFRVGSQFKKIWPKGILWERLMSYPLVQHLFFWSCAEPVLHSVLTRPSGPALISLHNQDGLSSILLYLTWIHQMCLSQQ